MHVTYDRAVYRVHISTAPYVDVGGFRPFVRELERDAPDQTTIEVLDRRNRSDGREYLVLVFADSAVHPPIQEQLGLFANHIAGAVSSVEAADVAVGVMAAVMGCRRSALLESSD